MTIFCSTKRSDGSSDTDGIFNTTQIGDTASSDQILLLPDGSVAAPSLQFIGDPNTGLAHTADKISFITGGNVPLILAGNQLLADSGGSASAPTISFEGDPNTGMYLVDTDNPGITAGGVIAQQWTATGFSSAVQPQFMVEASGGQTLTTSTNTVFTTWGTPDYNIGFTSFTSGVLTIATTGRYLVSYAMTFLNDTTGVRVSYVENIDTSDLLGMMSIPTATGTFSCNTSGCWVGTLTAAHRLRVVVQQSSGDDLDAGLAARTFLSVHRLY